MTSARAQSELTGDSPAMQRLRDELSAIAPLESNVLLAGETGTGKGRAARLLHEHSTRADAPFVHVDCAALSGGLIESELFGHERGAFTGAQQQYAGRFERAGRGTIFLDEIGDLAPELQAKLLRVLEDREFERVGGMETLRMRARVIAASSRRLFPAGSQAAFRTDLYFRLSVFQLDIPPLRERLDDLPALVESGVERLCAEHAWSRPRVTQEFLSRLVLHGWPGNVRELMNTLERALARHRGDALVAADVDEALLRTAPPEPARASPSSPKAGYGLRQELEEIERREIVDALTSTGGNIARAARRLSIPRGTLRHKLRKLSIAPPGDRTDS